MYIKIWEEIQKDEEFLFLYDCLICKHSYFNGLHDADEDKYNNLCNEYHSRYSSSNI